MAPLGPRGVVRELVRDWLLAKKVPKIGFARALGTGLLLLLVVQAATGVVLSLFYAPTPDHAYDSIRYIDEDLSGGRLLRGIHHYGASSVIVLLVAHMVRVFITGAYKRPRAVLWWVGLLIFFVTLGFGFTGYLLPWDQKGYWATAVGLSIAETVPVVGGTLAEVLRGGVEVGALTLTRLYALHVVVLPPVLFGLVGVHLYFVHRLGITPPGARVGEPEEKSEPFFPDHVLRECLVGVFVLALTVTLAAGWGPPLEAPAARDAVGYKPRPDWYFLGLYQLLKYFEGSATVIGTVVIPGAVTTALFLLPLIDRSSARSFKQRPVVVGAGTVILLAVAGLTALGAMDEKTESVPPERVPISESGYEAPPSPPISGESASEAAAADPGLQVLAEYECRMCHTLRGEGDEMDAGAPELVGAVGDRERKQLISFLKSPTKEFPETEMPSVDDLGMTAAELGALADFLLSIQP